MLNSALNYLELFRKYWKFYSFEIIMVLCILFFLVFGIVNKIKGGKGTWSKYYYYNYNDHFDVDKKNSYKNKKITESKGELECRRVLEKVFRKPFNKIRPNFLNNPVTGGNNLEIDCYNDQLKLGVEYSGKQHYQFVPYFHRNKEAFWNQKYRDEMKKRLCKDNNILLIEVPYTIKINDIESFLLKELRKNNYY